MHSPLIRLLCNHRLQKCVDLLRRRQSQEGWEEFRLRRVDRGKTESVDEVGIVEGEAIGFWFSFDGAGLENHSIKDLEEFASRHDDWAEVLVVFVGEGGGCFCWVLVWYGIVSSCCCE